MKRSSKFILVVVAAALTFGSLTAFIGSRQWRHHRHCYAYNSHEGHHRHWGRDREWRKERNEPENKQEQKPDADTSRKD